MKLEKNQFRRPPINEVVLAVLLLLLLCTTLLQTRELQIMRQEVYKMSERDLQQEAFIRYARKQFYDHEYRLGQIEGMIPFYE
jgi:hypothetical protein